MDAESNQHWPVVIAGGGPVGMTLAAELGIRGVRTLVLEQARETTDNPRCNTTNARSMEYFRRLGVADRIRRAGLPVGHPTDVVYCTALTGWELTRFPFSSSGDILSGHAPEFDDWPTPEPQHRISQIYLEPILEEHVRSMPSVQIRRANRVEGVTQEGMAATVDVIDVESGREYRVTADYVVGCDGGGSTVRRSIGAVLQGDSRVAEARVSVYFRCTELARHLGPRPGWMYWWFGPELHGSFVQLDGEALYLCHARVPEDMEPEDLDADRILEAALGRPMPHEKIKVVRWTPRRLVADRFRDDRVLLAGDAAHLWLPLGGFGMNTGIADAVGLGWRLAALLDDWGGERLFDDYATERRSVGEATSRAAVKIDKDMDAIGTEPELRENSREGAALRQRVGELIQQVDRQQWFSQGVQFGSRYTGSPGTDADAGTEGPAIEGIGVYVPSVTPGVRFPHHWRPDRASIFDQLGRDLTIVRVGPSAPPVDALVEAAVNAGIPLTELAVAEDDAVAVYHRPLVLVRPDMYVAWSGDVLPADPGELLARLFAGHAPVDA
ncbi:FAD-dependent monooxygenase [Streptomyces sp. NPDC047043]|uniref:FAD-dependent monooxygenase n=1 Tax=Streptomyces sp. NPDC047043 TaxID=3154497 RepID=UPI0033E926A9